MIASLYISNFVLIEELTYEPSERFSVITGETGAGKSIVLGAIDLLMGKRADSSVVRPGAKKCVIEAVFTSIGVHVTAILSREELLSDSDAECIVRREIMPGGKSRAFVNDTPVSLTLLKELGEYLVDVHSQHKNLLLADANFQLDVLDTIASNDQLLQSYKAAYTEYRELQQTLDKLYELKEKELTEQDYVAFQFNQLAEAKLIEGELEQLEMEAQRLTHAQEIKQHLTWSYNALTDDESGVLMALHVALDGVKQCVKYLPEGEELQQRLHSCKIELDDIASTLDALNEQTSFDPERIEQVTERIDLINTLLTKHRATTVDELIALQRQLEERMNLMLNYDEQIASIKQRVAEQLGNVQTIGEKLHKNRIQAGEKIAKHLVKELSRLGIPHIRFEVQLHSLDKPRKDGYDEATFLFSANLDMAPEPVADIASGGEVARLMLSLKAMLAKHKSLPTIIFDEIDTGVSGDIAERIGVIMREMAQTMQVIAVTHLPQIAAAGDQHDFVYKEVVDKHTHTRMVQLTDDLRVEEIARMQSGDNLSDVAKAAAKELINKFQ